MRKFANLIDRKLSRQLKVNNISKKLIINILLFTGTCQFLFLA